jgi:hypothetical protein
MILSAATQASAVIARALLTEVEAQRVCAVAAEDRTRFQGRLL